MNQSHKLTYVALIGFLICITGLGVYLFANYGTSFFMGATEENKVESVYIADVPYLGHYNLTGDNAFLTSGNSSAVASVMRFFDDDKNLAEVDSSVRAALEVEQSYVSFISLFRSVGLKVSDTDFNRDFLIETLADGSPLFALITLDAQSKGSVEAQSHHPVVIVGYDRTTDVITMHSYWYGPAYQLSFSDFIARHDSQVPDRFYALAVDSSEETVTSANVTATNPYERDPILDTVQPMMQNFALAILASSVAGHLSAENEAYLNSVANNENFELLHPYVRVSTLVHLAGFAYRNDDFDEADRLYSYIYENNQNMDKPFGPWAGFNLIENALDHKGELSYMFYGFGNYNKYRGNVMEALSAYEQAVTIEPSNTGIREILEAYKIEQDL